MVKKKCGLGESDRTATPIFISYSFQFIIIIMIMHIAASANFLSIASSAAKAAVLLHHPYRRHLYSSSSSSSSLKKEALFSILNWRPPNLFINNNTKINPMNILSAASLSSSTARSPAEPSPSADEPDKPKTKPPPQPWLIVGLGNPGKRYNSTRHNVGFEMVDKIAEAEGISMSSVSFKALFGKGFIGNVPVMLAKPQTFMNASGESVGAIVSYYKIPLKQVLVIFDDMDLPFAKLRLLPKGGHGGHNGMKSIINHLKGSRDFPRLRIGIGRPPGKMDAANFVLRPFSKEERRELDFMFQNGSDAMRILLLEGFDKSATFVNSAKPLEYNC